MKCKNCNNQISENEIFCDNCKKILKNTSSKVEVKELEKLIEDQNKLNELENTKEIADLTDLIDEQDISTELNENDSQINITREELMKDKNEQLQNTNKNKKKIIIIISLVILILITFIISLIILLNKNNKKTETVEKVDYELVLNSYGKQLEKILKNYLDKDDKLPTWSDINQLVNSGSHDIVCDIHNIYNDGSVYLNSCKIDGKKIKYSYGEEKEEIKEGKKIQVYKIKHSDNFYSYSDKDENNSSIAGTVTCETEECFYINAYDKYVLIKEQNKYYLYDYENDVLVFGPFDIIDENLYFYNILSYENTVYAIYYNKDGINNIYNIKTQKNINNVKGSLLANEFNLMPNIMLKYNYVVLNNKGKNDFLNLKTGNISYSINDTIDSFIEHEKNKIVYMTIYNKNNNKFKIYNSNGKLLFDGMEFSNIKIENDNLIVFTEFDFKIYDSKLNVKVASKKYDKILTSFNGYVVVLDNNHLEILDFNDKILATFDDEWDYDNYYFNTMLSGWNVKNEKAGIYLVIQNKDNYNSILKEYYYIPDTKEIGVIEPVG